MQIIDTHSHIYLEELAVDVKQIMERAESEGVRMVLMPAIDSQHHKHMQSLEASYPAFCRSMMGLHPCSVKENWKEELSIASGLLANNKFIAIGEIGLDFYWDLNFSDQQYEAFRLQLGWALQYNLPVSIHSRNATDECIEVVSQQQNGNLTGVFHCFSGNTEQAKKIMDLGLYLGIGGVITFKNSGLDKVIREVGLEHVVLETDAPYLAPVPFRGKRNEPSYLNYVVNKLAEVTGLSREMVSEITTRNAKEIFSIE
jgi:TatD DNase family protein